MQILKKKTNKIIKDLTAAYISSLREAKISKDGGLEIDLASVLEAYSSKVDELDEAFIEASQRINPKKKGMYLFSKGDKQ